MAPATRQKKKKRKRNRRKHDSVGASYKQHPVSATPILFFKFSIVRLKKVLYCWQYVDTFPVEQHFDPFMGFNILNLIPRQSLCGCVKFLVHSRQIFMKKLPLESPNQISLLGLGRIVMWILLIAFTQSVSNSSVKFSCFQQ